MNVVNSQKEKTSLPQVGLFACFSGGSNTGSLAGLAALEAVKRMGSDIVGVCSLPALLNEVPRQSALVKKIGAIIVIDGCHQTCASQLINTKGIIPTVTINIEKDLGIQKLGPFTSLSFTNDQLDIVVSALIQAITSLLHRENGKNITKF